LATVPGVDAQSSASEIGFSLTASRDETHLRDLASQSAVVIAPSSVVSLYPSLQQIQPPLVLDMYIPLMLEELQRERPIPRAEQALFFDRLRREMVTQVLAADMIICASEKQRDYWLGVLSATGRINPYTHFDDPTLRRLIQVVPFGLPDKPPVHARQVIKGVHPGIGATDKVLLWGGALYDWLDAPTIIRSMGLLRDRHPDIKLFFMGAKHPNPQESQRQGTQEALSLTNELGLDGKTVFFNEWVPYEERANYLLEADIGISLHRDHLETTFSFRTRLLDYIWSGLPIIATQGDVLSELVEKEGLGKTVAPGDDQGLAEAILELLDVPDLRQSYREHFERVAVAYRWENVIRPLAEFCATPRAAADKDYGPDNGFQVGPTPWWKLPGRAWQALRAGGLRGLRHQIAEYRRWILGRRGRG
jgi:glycosyltransferase involved in cell wall biosynthesis